jgi:hypothetical protein
MLFNSWLDSFRRVSSLNRRSRERVTRRAGRLGCAAEFLEDRVMLSAAHDPALIIAAAEAASPDDYVAGEMLARFNPGFSEPTSLRQSRTSVGRSGNGTTESTWFW